MFITILKLLSPFLQRALAKRVAEQLNARRDDACRRPVRSDPTFPKGRAASIMRRFHQPSIPSV